MGRVLRRRGGKHDWYTNKQLKVSRPVPRQADISQHLARHIIRKRNSSALQATCCSFCEQARRQLHDPEFTFFGDHRFEVASTILQGVALLSFDIGEVRSFGVAPESDMS